jgi:Fe2+ transport system protein FeoA
MDDDKIEVKISDELKKELASLGIDADKEIQQGIQMGLSDGGD